MSEKINIREAAADTLLDMERTGKLSHIAIGDGLMRLAFAPKQDRAFYTLLCEGTTELRIYLDYMLDKVSKTRMSKCKPFIRSLLRLSAYQILCTNVRDAAACNEAVTIAKKRGFRNLAGFVNGVLRGLVRKKDEISLPDKDKEPLLYLSVRYSMPLWIVEYFNDRFDREITERMLASFLTVRPTTIRVNTRKITPEDLLKELKEDGLFAEPGPWFPYALTIAGFNHPGRIPSFKRGCFTIQDVSSMLPVAAAQPEEGDFVIDVCAAPGGKTFHAADMVGPSGRVLAQDLTEYKTDLIEENNDRIGYNQIDIRIWDASEADETLYETADLVIADLPCSGLGIMGRKNDIKYHISREQMEELVSLQRKILSVVWKYVKPGGQLIFSTCTINEKENEENVRWLLDHTPLSLASIEERLPKDLRGRTGEDGYIQILPGIDQGDGFFVSRFIRKDKKGSS